MVSPPDKAPIQAPPAKVDMIAPSIGEALSVLKKLRKFCDAITSVMTPES
jgi:hypothetical protein